MRPSSPRVEARVLCALALALVWIASTTSSAWAHPITLDRDLPALGEYFRLGVGHILTGIDHLLFLAGLVLVGGKTRDLLWAVTAFTVAHSITLGLCMFGVVTPSPGGVEVLIALSIAYVGIENFFVRDATGRWRLTLAFGLVHGFGFAGALSEIGLPEDRAAAALALFNLGVETGQLAVLAVVLPLLALMRRSAPLQVWGTRAMNVGLVAIGLFWAYDRTLSAREASKRDDIARVQLESDASHSRAALNAGAPHSIFPAKVTPTPQVAALCEAFQALPRARRAECANRKPGVDLSGECERMLGTVLGSSTVRVQRERADACVAATRERYQDCAFSKAVLLPPLAACKNIWQGALANGERCRSSLECQSGLHCHGVGPMDEGVCGAPKTEGACEQAVDPLMAFVPADAAAHPECAGTCAQGRCTAATSMARNDG